MFGIANQWKPKIMHSCVYIRKYKIVHIYVHNNTAPLQSKILIQVILNFYQVNYKYQDIFDTCDLLDCKE